MKAKVNIGRDAIADFCKKWKITECALFGSVLRDDFAPDSDIDVLVSFDSSAHWSLFDFVEMREELKVPTQGAGRAALHQEGLDARAQQVPPTPYSSFKIPR
jgi:predicted nucleotidyltransferase